MTGSGCVHLINSVSVCMHRWTVAHTQTNLSTQCAVTEKKIHLFICHNWLHSMIMRRRATATEIVSSLCAANAFVCCWIMWFANGHWRTAQTHHEYIKWCNWAPCARASYDSESEEESRVLFALFLWPHKTTDEVCVFICSMYAQQQKKIEFNVRPRSNAMRNRKTTVADLMAWRHRRSVDICIKIVDRFEKWRVRNAHIFSSLRVRTLANGMYKSMLLRRVQKEACRTSQNKIAMKECHAMPCYRLNQNIAGEQNNRRNWFSSTFLSWLKPILHGNMSRRMVHWCICKMRSVRAVYILGKVTVQDGHEGVRLMHRRPCGPNRHGSQTLVCPIKMHCLDGSYSYSYICANCRAHAIVVH